jgi:hypothetical protein
MKLALLLLAAYAAIITACYVPFNDFRFINTTFFRETMDAELAQSPAMGWATIIKGNSVIQPWPRVNDHVSISYCYEDRRAYNTLHTYIETANTMWRDKLGPPSQASGHRFKGLAIQAAWSMCHDRTGNWDPKLPTSSLAISLANDQDPPISNSFASCGYIPPVWSLEPGRHFMTIYHDARHDFTWHVLDVAHELGHVFGMVHEHQRLDRDQHVHYDCSKLAGYAAAKQDLAKLDDPDKPSMDDVCNSNWLGGHLLGFWAPADYSTDMGDTAGVKNPQDSSTEYDTKSIMTYPSWAHAATPDGDVTQVPLAQWKGTAPPPGTKPTTDNAELVAEVFEISDLDREFIKRTYPW